MSNVSTKGLDITAIACAFAGLRNYLPDPLDVCDDSETETIRPSLIRARQFKLASSPLVSEVVLLYLISQTGSDANSMVRHTIAQRIDLTNRLIEVLMNDEKASVRGVLADNKNVDPKVLHRLALDENMYVREHVADNDRTTTETLQLLSDDANHAVRRSVARNPNTPTETLKALALDPQSGVRLGVASNFNSDKHTLRLLAMGDHEYVAERALLKLCWSSKNHGSRWREETHD